MSEVPQILLEHRLKTLRLPTVHRKYDKVARHCAHEGPDHVAFLARLVELELIDCEPRWAVRSAARGRAHHLVGDVVSFWMVPGKTRSRRDV